MKNKKRLVYFFYKILVFAFIIGIGVKYPNYQKNITAILLIIGAVNIANDCSAWKRLKDKDKNKDKNKK